MRRFRRLGLFLSLLFVVAAQAAKTYPARYSDALVLLAKQDPKAEEAFRELLAERPQDHLVEYRLGQVKLAAARAMPNGPARAAVAQEARWLFLQAKDAGLGQPFVDFALAELREDGTIKSPAGASGTESDALMRTAQAAFADGKLEEAQADYQNSVALDPRNYSAALGLGDTFFARDKLDDALDWYHRASILQPDSEIPWRYAGDVLIRLGRKSEALDAYLAAVVAEPYQPLPFRVLGQYAHELGRKAGFRATPLPTGSVRVDHGRVTMEMSQGADPADTIYANARATWIRQHPDQSFHDGAYRPTLAEEEAALEGVLSATAHPGPSGKPEANHSRYDDALVELAHIRQDGMLAAHIFFTRGNADLAREYPDYRAAHREQLLAYLRRYFLGES